MTISFQKAPREANRMGNRLASALFFCAIAVAGICALSALGGCKSTPAERPVDEKPVATKPSKQKGYSRIEFASNLEGLLARREYDKAIESFSLVPEPDASSLSIRKLKLAVLVSANRLDDALTLANALEAENPKDADVLYSKAFLLGARGENSARSGYLAKTLQANPNHSDALAATAGERFSVGDYDGAKPLFVRAAAANPSNTDALLGLARVYYMKEDLPRARDTLDSAIAKNTSYAPLFVERARVRSETADLAGAVEDARKALELEPDVYATWLDLGTYYISMAKKKDAKEAFTRAINLDPSHYLAYIYRAGLNDDLGLIDESISDYKIVCRIYPRYYFAAETLGVLLWGKGDFAGSRDAFRIAITHAPNNPYYALLYSLCYFREGLDKEGKEFIANYLKTMNRETTEYFLVRLFLDKSGEADVLNRIQKETRSVARSRLLFYAAEYFDLYQSKDVANKYYHEVSTCEIPGFMEYRMSKWAVDRSQNANGGARNPAPKS